MPKMVGIILAAGKGTRMKSKLPKALHPICGKPMTRYVVDACIESGIGNCVVVIGHGADQVRTGLGEDVLYAIQEEQLGTGDACKQGLGPVDDTIDSVLVTPGDTPLITSDILSALSNAHNTQGNSATVLTAVLDDAGSYGRIVRNADDSVESIVEAKDASDEQKKIREINTGIYCFKLDELKKYLGNLTPANAQKEYYLTDVIGMMVADGLKVGAVVSPDPEIILGVNNRVDLASLTTIIRRRILNRLMLDGVTIVDPSSTYVDWDVQAGADTIIYPGSVLEKGTKIGEDCIVGPYTRLINVEIGNGVTVSYSTATDSSIGDESRVGPFANIRANCKLGRKVKMGDFVETKNTVLEDRVSMGHLAYVGDAVIGEHTNIGAGVITCNYDGFDKHRTIVGKEVFLGSDVTLVAPINIADESFIAAGSTITDDVPENALAIARSKQIVKEGWAKTFREKKKK